MYRQQTFNCCSKNIRYVRMSRGLSVEQVAVHIGESVASIEEYEDDPSIMPLDVALKLLKLYEVSFSSVCFRERIMIP